MTPTYLVTGASGGLGSGVLDQLLKNVPGSSIIATSGRAEAARHFLDRNIQFRQADYNDLDSLTKAFAGVDRLLFVSANTYDNDLRNKQHANIVNAAKAAGVKHTWYTSLAFGGYGSTSKIDVQSAHYATEALLKTSAHFPNRPSLCEKLIDRTSRSGITYTSVREGMYADSFPIFLNYNKATKTIYLPDDGHIAFAARSDLGEATANLMMKGGPENELVLLSGPRTHTLRELATAVIETTGKSIDVKSIPPEDYVDAMMRGEGNKELASFYERRLSWYEGIAAGDGATVSTTLAELLGREPMDGLDCVRKLLKDNPEYASHKAYA